ncbi:hypothetical protein B0H34DRAFT_733743 [Crassisporium funariophilum]|nr:hypothetical protein B0H34DRAFT_733743 [Crassisporium funariophilum]
MPQAHQEFTSSLIELPYELERDIFELAAIQHPGCAAKLTRVCRYVQRWIEAILYETIVLELPISTTRLFLRTFYSRPPTFFAKNVKQLYLTSIITFIEARRIISACSNLTTLVCWAEPRRLREGIIELPALHGIQKLSVKIEALWGLTADAQHFHFTPGIFANLSHLEIVNPPCADSALAIDWDGLCRLPALTHLAFGDLWGWSHAHLLRFFPRVLEECERLLALIVISRDVRLVDALYDAGIPGDPRLVVIPEFNWPMALATYWDIVRRGGPDFWFAADDIVLQQTSEVRRRCSY